MRTPQPDPPARARLFVALELPADARTSLAAWASDVLGGDESLRLVAEDALHVTLAFLGWQAEPDVGEIARTALGVAEGLASPVVRPRELVGLPSRRPHVLALDLDDENGNAAQVQAAVESALVGAGFHATETRSWRAHVTVARVRRGGRPPRGRFPDPSAAPIHVTDVVLYRSDLKRSGAEYTALARASLDTTSLPDSRP